MVMKNCKVVYMYSRRARKYHQISIEVLWKAFAGYYKLKPGKCKIEDVGENEAKLTFRKR